MTPSPDLDDAERLAWLRLCRSENVGPLTFANLLHRFGSASAAVAALPSLVRRPGPPLRLAPEDDVCREYERGLAGGLRLIGKSEVAYPQSLRFVEGAPPLLWVAGMAAVLARPTVAVVGARNASGNGLLFTERLVVALGSAGFVVVSGLARGIDARAHKAALGAGTVAVLAGGHERIYPPEHAPLAERIIAEGGAVISEMPLGWEPRGRDFPRRNRIVSGLSLGTVVVEAARRSGSLITARLAAEQGRDVFAVPGSPLDPRAEGTNDLLRQGATFCTGAADVIAALELLRDDDGRGGTRPHPRPRQAGRQFADDAATSLREGSGVDETFGLDALEDGASLLALLGPSPLAFDDLIRLSGLPAGTVRALLIELELSGSIERHDDGSLSRIAP